MTVINSFSSALIYLYDILNQCCARPWQQHLVEEKGGGGVAASYNWMNSSQSSSSQTISNSDQLETRLFIGPPVMRCE